MKERKQRENKKQTKIETRVIKGFNEKLKIA